MYWTLYRSQRWKVFVRLPLTSPLEWCLVAGRRTSVRSAWDGRQDCSSQTASGLLFLMLTKEIWI